MKIDKQKLIELLVEKTGMELEDVEDQLELLITKIKEAAEKGKALEIKGFGMFYFSQQGDLKFDPSEDLETEVNHKYTGMEPVEIKKPKDHSGGPVKEDDSSEKETFPDLKPGTEEQKKEEQEAGEKKREEEKKAKEQPGETDESETDAGPPDKKKEKQISDSEEIKETDEDKDEEQFDPFSELEQTSEIKDEEDLQSEKEKAREREESIKSLFPDLPDKEKEEQEKIKNLEKKKKSEEKGEKKPKEVSGEPKTDIPGKKDKADKEKTGKKVAGKDKSKKKSPKKKEKNPVTMIVAAVIAGLVLIVGVIVAMDTGLFGDPETADDVAQIDTDTPDPAADPQPGEMAEEETPEEPGQEPETEVPAETEVEEESEEMPLYGLLGDSQNIDENYYSIILHSMGSESRAIEMQEELQEDGYRAVITSVDTEAHGTMWRVGVGQFPTIPEAQEAAGQLPQNYRENNFIGLIQQ